MRETWHEGITSTWTFKEWFGWRGACIRLVYMTVVITVSLLAEATASFIGYMIGPTVAGIAILTTMMVCVWIATKNIPEMPVNLIDRV